VDLEDRDIRQRDIIPREKLETMTAVVIGVGAVGRQIALQLATIGVPRLVLVDPDTVEVENLAAQGFNEEDLGERKVNAVAAACSRLNSSTKIVMHAAKFNPRLPMPFEDTPEGETPELCVSGESSASPRLFFCCVDTMEARKEIWQWLEFQKFFIDTRMAAEVARIFCVTADDPYSSEHYPTTLFTDAEAHPASCTSKTTFYCASLCASLAVAQLAKWLRDIPTDMDMTFNIMTGDLEFASVPIPATAEA
jgi:hypothetical protein